MSGEKDIVIHFYNEGISRLLVKEVLINERVNNKVELGVSYDTSQIVQSGTDNELIVFGELDSEYLNPRIPSGEIPSVINKKEMTPIHYGIRIKDYEEPIESITITYKYLGFPVTKEITFTNGITVMEDSKISDVKGLTLVLEQSGREDIQIDIKKLPVLLSYLTQSDDPELEMSRLRSTFLLTHQEKDYFLVSFNCGVKLCDQLLVEHGSKDEVQSIQVSESSIFQDVKQQDNHLALLFGRTEGVAVVRNQIALLNLKELIKVSPPQQLEVLESFEYPIARIEWKDNALKADIADLEEPTFENIMEWNQNDGEPIQELLWEFK